MAKRGVVVLLVMAFLLIGVCWGRVAYIALIKGDEYKTKAETQQLSVTTVNATRGTIYDRNMNVLAQSAAVWLVHVNPSKVDNENREVICNGLAEILGLDAAVLREKLIANAAYGYLEVKDEIEYEQKTKIQEFINNEDLYGIVNIDPDTIRYYPNGNLCSTIIGFTGKDDDGLAGIEYYYDDELTGTDGRIVTAKDGSQQPMPDQFMTTYDAQQGASPVLTIDSEIQTILESALQTALIENDAQNVYGVVMDIKTGAILGMANLPNYDPNDPYTLTAEMIAEIEAKPEEEQDAAFVEKQNELWRNKLITDFYEPGSVAKVFLVASALEEGVISADETYECEGRITVNDRNVKDYNPVGHGVETLEDLLVNSCNTFSVHIATEHLKKDLFNKYFQAFGFTERTGIDLPGEGDPIEGVMYHAPETFTTSNLVSCSFGQSFTITPLQMITAISCVANDGKLMTPYIVDRFVDEQGNTIVQNEPVVRRQVISPSTSEKMLTYMEQVILRGTGTNAYVPGYRIAGKTGTSEKLGKKEKVYIASFAGVAPADDPSVAVLILIDEPGGVNYSGGVIASPVGGQVFEKILPYLGIEPVYTEEELNNMSSPTPEVVGLQTAEAEQQLQNKGYEVRVIGDGEKVLSQSPEAGRSIMDEGIIILYTQEGVTSAKATVPDFSGMTVGEANYYASQNGLNIKITGSTLMTNAVKAYRQSEAAGTQVEPGTIVTVYFRSDEANDDVVAQGQ